MGNWFPAKGRGLVFGRLYIKYVLYSVWVQCSTYSTFISSITNVLYIKTRAGDTDTILRFTLLGLWTCHQYVGDIAAAFFSAYILSSSVDWRWCIVVPAVINGAWAFVNLWTVPNRPEEAG